jgi:glycosyltransferase involved in cell wall biosynthesis
MKVALVSIGLGRVFRGFESFTESLFQALELHAPDLDLTLFQGGGKKEKGRVFIPNFNRNDVPARWFEAYKANLLEQRSFAILLYPKLLRGGYDIVHYNELVMGSALFRLRRWFGGRFKLLYCNGAPSPPIHYHHRCDFAQVLTRPAYEEARKFGLADNRLFLIPYGVDAKRFSPELKSHRSEIRDKLGIPEEAKVVLSVAALKREHKRLDYLIREIGNLDKATWLLAAGERTEETPSLEEEARRFLCGRWRFVTWPYEKIHLLYGAADVFVHASLTEAFGLVIVEAMFSGLPILLHDSPVFRWISNGRLAQLIDMSTEGELTKVLKEVLSNNSCSDSRDEAIERFSWGALISHYLNMYERVINS